MKKAKFKSAEEYFKNQPPDARKQLLALRAIILKTASKATELINYELPAYALVEGGKRDKQIMIAGYKTFVGFYPGTGILEHFSKELTKYTVGKASAQFLNNEPLPKKLIEKIIKFKVKKTASNN